MCVNKTETETETDNRFGSLGGGHTALLSYHSHRGYFKASNCENSAVF